MLLDADWCWLMLINAHWCSKKVQRDFLLSERTSGASPVIFWYVMMMIVLFCHCDLWPSGSMQDTEIKFDILSNKGGPFHILWHTHLFQNYFLNGNENWKKRLIQHGWFLDRSYFTKGLPEGDSTLSYLVTHSLTLSLRDGNLWHFEKFDQSDKDNALMTKKKIDKTCCHSYLWILVKMFETIMKIQDLTISSDTGEHSHFLQYLETTAQPQTD